jgi:transposase
MEKNISFSIGPLALMERIENKFKLFEIIFEDLAGKAKNLKKSAKLFTYNKLAESIAICRLKEVYPYELFEEIGFKEEPNERAIYRDLARIGKKASLILDKYQLFLKRNALVSSEQFMDFSSSYFEGNPKIGALGYSRDGMPGKKQITFGISTGMNGIPSALTIQKGNVQDKKHFKSLFKTAKKILNIGSMIIFDCGANTKKNKEMIRKSLMNYLTLVAKNKKLYKRYLKTYKENKKEIFTSNGIRYKCVKISEDDRYKYIYYSKKARKEQLKKKARKFAGELAKNDSKILSKVKKGKSFAKYQTSRGIVYAKGEIQKQFELVNPFITGLEGYFILESSVDEDPYKILVLYKQRDKAEKLIRDMKEGTDLRPIRHFSDDAIVGYILIVFLTNCLIQLTHLLNKDSVVKNGKLLKKFINNLTVTIIYYPNRPKIKIISNFSKEIESIFGDFLEKYRKNQLSSWL